MSPTSPHTIVIASEPALSQCTKPMLVWCPQCEQTKAPSTNQLRASSELVPCATHPLLDFDLFGHPKHPKGPNRSTTPEPYGLVADQYPRSLSLTVMTFFSEILSENEI